MYNIDFLEDFLIKKVSNKVTINMFGMLEFKIDISKFDYEIIENKLIIKEGKKIFFKVIFDEVREVKNIDDKIIIEFNIKETIVIE